MDNKARARTASELLETAESLQTAIREAGGSCINVDEMKNMTLFYFICHMAAPNGIRFKFIEQKKIGKH